MYDYFFYLFDFRKIIFYVRVKLLVCLYCSKEVIGDFDFIFCFMIFYYIFKQVLNIKRIIDV